MSQRGSQGSGQQGLTMSMLIIHAKLRYRRPAEFRKLPGYAVW